MVANPNDISRMSAADLQNLLFEFQARQMELELQNEQLRASLGCHEDLFEKSPIACILLDDDNAIIRINAIARQIFGNVVTANSLINKSFTGIIHPEDSLSFESFLNQLSHSEEPLSTSFKLNQTNGDTKEIECRGCLQASANGKQSCLTFSDITQYKQNESELAGLVKQLEKNILKKTEHLTESNEILKKTVDELNYSRHQLMEREAKLNSILNASIEGIVVIDTVGTIVSVNAAVEQIFGFSAEDLIGNRVNLLMPISFKRKQAFYLEKYLRIFIPKAIGQIREVEGLRKDGSLVPLDMTIAEFPLDGQQYYSGIVRDVSARKMQELQEKEHLEKLAHVTRLGLMGEMASGIAHEVNQPLSAVVNYTKVCLNFIENENPDLKKIGEILQRANQQALKAGQIIHNMREFVKPRKIHRSTVDINELLYDAVTIFEADFKQHLVAMRFELTKNLPPVLIDKVQIEQVFLNLIRNSIDALKDLPQFTQRMLSVETSLNEFNYIVVRVKDNGPGLTPLQREKILTPFFTTKSSGMGMGLSISRSLVEAHHGTLHFNSKEDKGTTFYFTLPTEKVNNVRNQA